MNSLKQYVGIICLLFLIACGEKEKKNNETVIHKEYTNDFGEQNIDTTKQFVKIDSVYSLILALRLSSDTVHNKRNLGNVCGEQFYDITYLPNKNETEIQLYNSNYVETRNNRRYEYESCEYKSYVVALLCKIRSSDKYIAVLRSSIGNDGKYIFVYLKKYEERLYVIKINATPIQIVGENLEYINSIMRNDDYAYFVIKTSFVEEVENLAVSIYRAALIDNLFEIDEVYFTTISNPLNDKKTDSLKIETINFEQMISITQLRREFLPNKELEWNIIAVDTIK
ncbi:MAG: hypothetical protein HYZ10_14400 [Ignavibacteriales bacterium]|nr:hypothetical protein [Ignavibacteriales bacterium]